MFQSLPSIALKEWLPPGAPLRAIDLHLNVANPLASGTQNGSRQWRHSKGATDPVLKAYYESRVAMGAAMLDAYREQQVAIARLKSVNGEEIKLTVYNNTNNLGNKFQRKVVKLRDLHLTVSSSVDFNPTKPIYAHCNLRTLQCPRQQTYTLRRAARHKR